MTDHTRTKQDIFFESSGGSLMYQGWPQRGLRTLRCYARKMSAKDNMQLVDMSTRLAAIVILKDLLNKGDS